MALRRWTPNRDRAARNAGRSVGLGGLLLAVVGLAACGGSPAPGESGKPLVVATTTQLADFSRQVGGDAFEVYGLLRPNVDGHDYEPSPADMDALRKAAVVVRNGLGLEPWLDDALDASGSRATVVDSTEGVAVIRRGGAPDPHVWLDPRNARVMVDHIADTLANETAAEEPAGADVRARAVAYDAALAELDRWIAAKVDALDDPKLVTDHDAFGYFVRRYDLTFVGSVIPSFDSAAEVSPADLDDLVRAIRAQHVKAVFTEQSLPPRAAEALARRAHVDVVAGADGLYGDSLGPAGSPGATYLGMMRHNTTTIVEHLS
jgi:ABC-type Zn uptake system ZnuABC Zn-binding protein ZnuA